MVQPVTPTEQLLQQIVDSNKEIVDELQQLRGQLTTDGSASDAPSPAPDAASQGRRPTKTTTARGRKGTEVRGD